uniref:Autophagy-related protein 18b n=1 Tax=Kalanchoe fedtschenkoi TaxID=63787 RepID=A0A7N0VH74_KALFE
MSNQSSSYPILCASFNQDNTSFAVGTKNGFRIFDSSTGRLCYERVVGAFNIVEMLFSSSLLAIVGAGEQPALSPRRLCMFNTITGNPLRELNFLTSILAVRMNKRRLVVVLQEKTFVYDLNTVAILDTIDTVPNAKGLCAFSCSLDGCYLALPASTTKGSVLIYNVMEFQSHCEIEAHRSPLAAITLSANGMYLATASEQGTIIRVHLVSDASKIFYSRIVSGGGRILRPYIPYRWRRPLNCLTFLLPRVYPDLFTHFLLGFPPIKGLRDPIVFWGRSYQIQYPKC